MATKSFRLKFVREGREFEAEGDKAFVLEMLKRYGPSTGEADKRAGARAGGRAEPALLPSEGKSLSIREFIQQLGLKKHTDITLAFGYFLEKYQGMGDFTPADINNCYYDAKLEPSNTSQMISQNIKRAYLMPSKKPTKKSKGRYTLTSSGEAYVQSKLIVTS